jgi:hypothetical protein
MVGEVIDRAVHIAEVGIFSLFCPSLRRSDRAVTEEGMDSRYLIS